MNELLLLKGNPARRRKSGKRRSPAQRAATRRMLAANRMRSNPAPKRRKRRKSASRKARRASTSVVRHVSHRRVSRRRGGRVSGGVSGNIISMLKNGAIAGGGAIAADIGMGLITRFAPTMTNLTQKQNADGSMNYMYYGTKLGIIYAMAKYGSKVTRYAPAMAAGALAVTGYELMRSMYPAEGIMGVQLGYFNPGRLVQGGQLGNLNKIIRPGVNGLNRVMSLPNNGGKGAAAMAIINRAQGVNGLARR